MRSISDTIERMRAIAGASSLGGFAVPDRLDDLTAFGSNPGALGARIYVPVGLARRAPLIVVLHGCTQTAAGYDHGSGWSQLADRFGFAVLFPEQRRTNNQNLCFNWFDPADSRRDSGEALSIRQMIAAGIDRHDLDPARVFVTGLSAGGAMTSVMLATYPEVFAGGAIIAGLPYGSATTMPQALDRMRGHGGPDGAALTALVRRASHHQGPWPTIAIWHGTMDATVDPINADAILAQWRTLHDVGDDPSISDSVDGYPHRAWRDGNGRTVIEDYRITGMGHGAPLDTYSEDGCGSAGAYMLEAQISSTLRIAQSWGIAAIDQQAEQTQPATADLMSRVIENPATPTGPGIAGVIEDALRSAGLMR
jgi:poly(hydroxyalkanoate) depolymerase family esterase